MSVEIFVIIFLGILLILQQVFYAVLINKFTNKIMSGTYTAYAQTNALVKENKPMDGFSIQLPQDEEKSELDQLNAMLKLPF